MRKLWILVCAMAIPCVASGQTDHASWDNLNKLHAGQKIQVVKMNSKKDFGALVSVSVTAISLQGKDGQQSIQRADVRSVKLMENRHRLRNAIVGGAIGAGTGAIIGAAAGGPTCNSSQPFCLNVVGRGGTAGIFAAIGGVVGAVIGAVVPSHETIYRTQTP
jgi:hypothetical protein